MNLISLIAGAGSISMAAHIVQALIAGARILADRREARAALSGDAERDMEQKIHDAIVAGIQEAIERKALPPPTPPAVP